MSGPAPGGRRPALRALAEHAGILASYLDQNGRDVRETADETREALVAAMGLDGSTELAAEGALVARRREERERLVAPVLVWREYEHGRPGLHVTLPDALAGKPLRFELELELEDGALHARDGTLPAFAQGAQLDLPLPVTPAQGYHHVRLVLRGEGAERHGEQSLVMAPRTCFSVAERLGDRKAFGLWTNLYTVRRRGDWGIGDLGALHELVTLAANIGASFVGVNPLHATLGRGSGVSPYSPVSRLFKNPLYLDVEAIPELAESEEAMALVGEPGFQAALRALRASPAVDYAGVQALREPVLRALHRTFRARHEHAATARGDAWRTYCNRQGDALRDFCTFLALRAAQEAIDPLLSDWLRWPTELREPGRPAVEAFRLAHEDEISFHAWLQFELDRQLGATAAAARDAGLPIGVYEDLAIGSAPDSSDTWAFPHLFLRGVSVGAPPDDYSSTGQDWGLPPLDPLVLRANAYRYFVLLLRAAFAHAGALRIDHVMGLFRLFVIPAGRPGSEGAYLRYPADDLLGILALESRRHQALVVGEDLGTVPENVPGTLASWGILSSRVLYFERDDWSGFRPSGTWSPRALATANTHDLPPLAGWFEDRDLLLRREVGQIGTDEELTRARTQRAAEKGALIERLVNEGCLAGDGREAGPVERCAAVNSFLCRTPAPLVGVSLDDLALETEPVNLPGVPVEAHPSWSRRMRLRVDELAEAREVREALAPLVSRALASPAPQPGRAADRESDAP